jgi:hypothetical protein
MQERGLSAERGSNYLLLNPPGDTTAGGGQNSLLSTELPQEKQLKTNKKTKTRGKCGSEP